MKIDTFGPTPIDILPKRVELGHELKASLAQSLFHVSHRRAAVIAAIGVAQILQVVDVAEKNGNPKWLILPVEAIVFRVTVARAFQCFNPSPGIKDIRAVSTQRAAFEF